MSRSSSSSSIEVTKTEEQQGGRGVAPTQQQDNEQRGGEQRDSEQRGGEQQGGSGKRDAPPPPARVPTPEEVEAAKRNRIATLLDLEPEELENLMGLLQQAPVRDPPAMQNLAWTRRPELLDDLKMTRKNIRERFEHHYGLTYNLIQKQPYIKSIEYLCEFCTDIVEDMAHLQQMIESDKEGGWQDVLLWFAILCFSALLVTGTSMVYQDVYNGRYKSQDPLDCSFSEGTVSDSMTVTGTVACTPPKPTDLLLYANIVLVVSSVAFFVQFFLAVLIRCTKGSWGPKKTKEKLKESTVDEIQNADKKGAKILKKSNIHRMLRLPKHPVAEIRTDSRSYRGAMNE